MADRVIRQEFQSHDLNNSGLLKLVELRLAFSRLLDDIERHVPAGRERALVVTKLQEASMFATRGVAVAAENQGTAG